MDAHTSDTIHFVAVVLVFRFLCHRWLQVAGGAGVFGYISWISGARSPPPVASLNPRDQINISVLFFFTLPVTFPHPHWHLCFFLSLGPGRMAAWERMLHMYVDVYALFVWAAPDAMLGGFLCCGTKKLCTGGSDGRPVTVSEGGVESQVWLGYIQRRPNDNKSLRRQLAFHALVEPTCHTHCGCCSTTVCKGFHPLYT